jgi:hypothetical protein
MPLSKGDNHKKWLFMIYEIWVISLAVVSLILLLMSPIWALLTSIISYKQCFWTTYLTTFLLLCIYYSWVFFTLEPRNQRKCIPHLKTCNILILLLINCIFPIQFTHQQTDWIKQLNIYLVCQCWWRYKHVWLVGVSPKVHTSITKIIYICVKQSPSEITIPGGNIVVLDRSIYSSTTKFCYLY